MVYRPVTAFPTLRTVVHESYESLPDSELAEVIARQLGMSAFDAENWLSNLGKTFQQIAPGMAQGALSGAATGAIGGPWTALAGGLIGGLTGALGSAGNRAAGPAPATGQPAASPPVPPQAPPVAGGAPAAASLLSIFSNPAVQQALMSMVLGRGTGRESIPVGESAIPVPVAAFANLVREAADQALNQYDAAGGGWESGESVPVYLQEDTKRGADTGNAFVRGVILAKLLDQPPYGYVPAVAAVPAAYAPPAPIAYAPAPSGPPVPGTPAAPPAPAAAPAVPWPGGFEPAPQYGTPDLGIGRPIPIQSVLNEALEDFRFEQSLDAIFDLNGSA